MAERRMDGTSGATRRDVVLGSAAFVLAFDMPAIARGGPPHAGPQSPVAAPLADLGSSRFNAFLAIDADGVVTALLAQTEGGQGNSTGMPQVIASELGADWSQMRVRFTTERRAEFINPILYKGLVLTAGSSSIPGFYKPMRRAAAATREMLVSAASRRWKVAAAECTAAASFVVHRPSGRRMSFGQLARLAAKEPVPKDPTLRPLAEQTLIGKRLSRLDVPAKVDGSARFGIDADVPGMLFAAVRHGRVRGADVKHVDSVEASAMPGVRHVQSVPQGVAVVADQYWQAVQALNAVRETYDEPVAPPESTERLRTALREGLEQPGDKAPQNHGDVAKGFADAVQIVEAEFEYPVLAHACMEPVSCTASVRGRECDIWLSTKCPTLDAGFAAEAIGADPATIVVHNEYQGGDFGRRSGREHVTEAVLLSQAVKRPVKVIWSREEDFRCDQHRTSALTRARMGLGADGMPVAYEIRTASDGVWRAMFPAFYAEKKPFDLPLLSLVGGSYGIPNEYGSYTVVPHGVRIGPMRGNSDHLNGHVQETMIDAAARAAQQDPLAYRLKLLEKDPRSTAVLKEVAKMSNWGQPQEGRHQGLAFYQSAFYKCRLAVVVEISQRPDGIKVERAFGVCDSGLVINPLLAERCIEGGIIFGLSNVMFERITLVGGAPEQRNLNDYRLLRINEAPSVEVSIISFGEEPGSIGEIGSIPAGAALGNAIFAATGRRFREQPYALNGATFA